MYYQSRVTNLILVISAALLLTIGSSAQAVSTQSASPLGNKDVGKTETAIGSLAADAVRALAKTDVAFVAASELKPIAEPIAAGKVDASSLTDLVSYNDDPLAVLELTGKQIRQALEKAVSIYPQSNSGFLQVSGLRFEFDTRMSAGSRILSITVNSSELDDSHAYTVAVSNSMTNGALGYWKIWAATDVKRRLQDATIVKAISSYLAANPKIDYGSPNRITAK